MGRRLELHDELVALLGSNNVYFQPPESVRINYPCIIYKLRSGDTKFADNNPYKFDKAYDLTYISKSPNNEMVDRIAMRFPMSRFDRFFTAENLNHYNFVLYF